MTDKQANDVVTTVRFTDDDAERLRRVANHDDRSMASVIRLAVRQYLKYRGEMK